MKSTARKTHTHLDTQRSITKNTENSIRYEELLGNTLKKDDKAKLHKNFIPNPLTESSFHESNTSKLEKKSFYKKPPKRDKVNRKASRSKFSSNNTTLNEKHKMPS